MEVGSMLHDRSSCQGLLSHLRLRLISNRPVFRLQLVQLFAKTLATALVEKKNLRDYEK